MIPSTVNINRSKSQVLNKGWEEKVRLVIEKNPSNRSALKLKQKNISAAAIVSPLETLLSKKIACRLKS